MMGHRPVLVLSELGEAEAVTPFSLLPSTVCRVAPAGSRPGPAAQASRRRSCRKSPFPAPLCALSPDPCLPAPGRAAGPRALGTPPAAAPLLAWFSVRGWRMGRGLAWPHRRGPVAPPDRLARASRPYWGASSLSSCGRGG